MSKSKIEGMTDDELIAILHAPPPEYMMEYQRVPIRQELHRRQKKENSYMLKMTLAILVLTIILVMFEFKNQIFQSNMAPPSNDQPSPAEAQNK